MVIKSKVGRKLLFFIILTSTFFSLLATVIQLFVDYHKEVDNLENRLKHTLSSNLNAIVNDVWTTDFIQVQDHITALSHLSDISYVSLELKNDNPLSAGISLKENVLITQRDLIYHYDADTSYNLGRLVLHSNLHNIEVIIWDKFYLILLTQTIKTFIVSFFILYLITYLITKHLYNISLYTKGFENGIHSDVLRLKNKKDKDELDDVVYGINLMKEALEREISHVKKSELALAELNNSLEEKVLLEIKKRKEKEKLLVEQENMASMGRMVAGVAHELNTPVGTAITGVSLVKSKVETIADKVENDQLKKSELKEFMKDLHDTSETLLLSLSNAGDLVRSFKLLSVVDNEEERHSINLSELIHSVVRSYKVTLKEQGHDIIVDCDESLNFPIFTGPFVQIINNLVENAIVHGFHQKNRGLMHITVKNEKGKLLIDFEDNGDGISSENLTTIFKPFFTTRRHKGGSGLGLSIIYNIVTQKFHGTIECESKVGQGTQFHIVLPLES